MQNITIVGNVGKDAVLEYTQEGIAVAKFTVAVNKTTNKVDAEGKKIKVTTWYRVIIWRQRAEALQPLIKKGQKVVVQGELKATAYIDNSGAAKPSLDVELAAFDWMGGEKPTSSAAAASDDEPVQQELPGSETETGDIPF